MTNILTKSILAINLSNSILKKLQTLENYDLSDITNSFTDDDHLQGRVFSKEQIYPIKLHFGKADIEIARLIESEFKKFVAITLIKAGVTHAPSGPIDMYWHFFILHTVKYRDFCEKIWGSYEATPIHH